MVSYKIVDVSIPLDAFTFPSNPKMDLKGPFSRVSGSNPEYVYDFNVCTQSGTHVQGPHYFIKDGKRISEFPLSSFEGDAYVYDFNKRNMDITLEELETALKHVNLKGKIFIIRTGFMEELIKDTSSLKKMKPGLSLEAAKYLCEVKEIKMIAIDSVGVESIHSKNYEVNLYLCQQEILILECLGNLHEINHKFVWLESYPLKIHGVEGTPCRAIVKEVLIDESN